MSDAKPGNTSGASSPGQSGAQRGARYLLPLMASLLALSFLSLLAGIGFFLIFTGLWVALSRLPLYWLPAREAAEKLIPFPDSAVKNANIPLTWWRFLFLAVRVLLGLVAITLGLRLIAQYGLCGQNFICQIIRGP